MKLAIAFSSKDQTELTRQTFERLCDPIKDFDIYWIDGSRTDEGLKYFANYRDAAFHSERIVGGADAGLAWKLTEMLKHPYTHVGLLENDCLLDEDWFEATLALFAKGKADGLEVGAVSARSYVDRILIQRDGYAVCHNLGAGFIIFSREAAEIVLRSFRTGFWRDNVRLFAQISGIDLRTYACFRGQEENPITSDWIWEAQLARHGLATLALTPSKASMIGQVPPLHEQGLELTQGPVEARRDEGAFRLYEWSLSGLRKNLHRVDEPGIIHRQAGGMLFFPHQMGHVTGAAYDGDWRLKWSQGWGPFAYRAGQGGASLSARISGSCSFLVSGGIDGASVGITDTRSGFKTEPQLPPEQGSFVEVNVPGGPVPREIILQANEGAVFYGLQIVDPQMIDTTFKFDWSVLPEV